MAESKYHPSLIDQKRIKPISSLAATNSMSFEVSR